MGKSLYIENCHCERSCEQESEAISSKAATDMRSLISAAIIFTFSAGADLERIASVASSLLLTCGGLSF